MKLTYCPSCRRVTMRSRIERNKCERCGGESHTVRVPYPWQYMLGFLVILAGAVFLLLPQAVAGIPWSPLVDTLGFRLAWLVVFVGIGFYLSNWGVRVMKAVAMEQGRQLYPEGEA